MAPFPPFFNSPIYASPSFWEVWRTLVTHEACRAPRTEKRAARTQDGILLIYLIRFLETCTSGFHGRINQPKINSLVYHALSSFQATSQNKLTLSAQLCKYGFEYWLLNPLWLLKGWRYPPGCELHTNDNHSGLSGASNMSPAASSLWSFPANLGRSILQPLKRSLVWYVCL